ncbi:MAG: hypothetical protein K1W33_07275, partial [Clostridia bacterium]
SAVIFMLDVAFLPNIVLNISRVVVVFLIIIALIGMIKHFRENYLYKMLFITFITWLVSFISFNISLPYSCTMHSRYITIMYLIGMLFIGRFYETTDKKWLKILISILTILYVLETIVTFGRIFTIN